MPNRPLHRTTLSILPPLQPEFGPGNKAEHRVRLACSFGCDLREARVRVVDAEGETLDERVLTRFRDGRSESDPFMLQAPMTGEEWTWGLVFDGVEGETVDHEAGALLLTASRGSATIDLTTWGAPSPVTVCEPFEVIVGASSSAGVSLAGTDVEVTDRSGNVIARAVLGDTPWAGTQTLFWTAVRLQAPAEEGPATWNVSLLTDEEGKPHDAPSVTFGVPVAAPANVRLTVCVVDKVAQVPVPGVEVRCHSAGGQASFSIGGLTDSDGRARLTLPAAEFTLSAWKKGYEVAGRQIMVDSDTDCRLDATPVPVRKKEDKVWG